MKNLITALGIMLLLVACSDKKEEFSGNPIVDGWYADPEGVVFDNEYWIYSTLSDFPLGADSTEFTGLQKKTRAIIKSIISRHIWMLSLPKTWYTGLNIPKYCPLKI